MRNDTVRTDLDRRLPPRSFRSPFVSCFPVHQGVVIVEKCSNSAGPPARAKYWNKAAFFLYSEYSLPDVGFDVFAGAGTSAIGCLGYEFSVNDRYLPPGPPSSAGDRWLQARFRLVSLSGRSGERLNGLSLTESDPGNTGAGYSAEMGWPGCSCRLD